MHRLLLLTLLAAVFLPLSAQEDPEYRAEIGVGGGMMGYLGDFNGSLTKDMQPMASVLARYNFDTYKCMRLAVMYGKMKGSSADVKTYYPAFAATPYNFSNTLVGTDVTFEYNFLVALRNGARLLRSQAPYALLVWRTDLYVCQVARRRQEKRLLSQARPSGLVLSIS